MWFKLIPDVSSDEKISYYYISNPTKILFPVEITNVRYMINLTINFCVTNNNILLHVYF